MSFVRDFLCRLQQKSIPLPFELSQLPSLGYELSPCSHPLHTEVKQAFKDLSTDVELRFSLNQGTPIASSKPLQVGVLLSGGQAPGGHNVILGLYHGMQKLNPQSQLWGFLGGPEGLLNGLCREITQEDNRYLHTGGFDMLGSGRTKIKSPQQFLAAKKTCEELSLDALVIIGGDDSNTNALQLAKYFQEHKLLTKVFGVPKTIDGDLQGEGIEQSFGFDTACMLYSHLISNLARDALSAKKAYHFVRLMGRHASHITLECALQTQVNLAFISEEIKEKNYSLKQLVEQLCTLIKKRKERKKDYGVILIPEGMVEFIPEFQKMLSELNECLCKHDFSGLSESQRVDRALSLVSKTSRENMAFLPFEMQKSLLLDRDPHGNVQVSKIEIEKLLAQLVAKELHEKGIHFSYHCHFLGYEGRSTFPSPFDASYAYALGVTAASLCHTPFTGFICSIKGLKTPAENWSLQGISLARLLHKEWRMGQEHFVIKKQLVSLNQAPFTAFEKKRKSWELQDHYLFVPPLQFF